jgi:hypothetical protein
MLCKAQQSCANCVTLLWSECHSLLLLLINCKRIVPYALCAASSLCAALQVCTAVANYKARSDHLSSGAVEAEWQDIAYWRDVQLSPKSTATTAFNSNDGSSTSSATTTTADNSSAATTSASGASAHSRHARSSSFAFANSLTVSALLSQAQNCAEVHKSSILCQNYLRFNASSERATLQDFCLKAIYAFANNTSYSTTA